MYETLFERIMANTVYDPETGCRIWQGQTDGKADPYGRITYRGQTIATHIGVMRHVLQKQGKRFPKGKQVDHKCNRRLCCEETHLQTKTNLANQRLRVKRSKHRDDAIRCLAVK